MTSPQLQMHQPAGWQQRSLPDERHSFSTSARQLGALAHLLGPFVLAGRQTSAAAGLNWCDAKGSFDRCIQGWCQQAVNCLAFRWLFPPVPTFLYWHQKVFGGVKSGGDMPSSKALTRRTVSKYKQFLANGDPLGRTRALEAFLRQKLPPSKTTIEVFSSSLGMVTLTVRVSNRGNPDSS